MTRLNASAEPIQILTGEDHPAAFDWHGQTCQIAEVNRRWRVEIGWWNPSVCTSREYWEVATDTGVLCLIHHDLPNGDWFLDRIYD